MISLIVPFYNSEKDIGLCLDSIDAALKNTSEDVEVIFVNDGSLDRSSELVDSFVNDLFKNSELRTKTIRQENGGLSDARNTGIKAANREFVGFLDADDTISEHYFSNICKLLKAYEYKNSKSIDILEFAMGSFVGTKGQIRQVDDIVRQDFCDEVLSMRNYHDIIRIFRESNWFAPKRVYKKYLFKDNKFPKGLNFEDIATIPLIFLEAETVYRSPEKLMWYQINPHGITQSPSISDSNSLAITLQKYFSLASRQDERCELYLLVVISTLNSLFHVNRKVYGKIRGVFTLRLQTLSLIDSPLSAYLLLRALRISSGETRSSAFFPELNVTIGAIRKIRGWFNVKS